MVNLGTFADVVHHHDESRRIRWLLEWTLPKMLTIKDPLNPGVTLFGGSIFRRGAKAGLRDSHLWVPELAYRFDSTDFRLHAKEGSRGHYELTTSRRNFRFKRIRGRAWPLPKPIKTHLFPGAAKTFFQNSSFLGDFELRYERLMDSLFYLGPLREHPKREYPWAGSRPDDVGQRGERTIDAILAATARGTKISLGRGIPRKPFQGRSPT